MDRATKSRGLNAILGARSIAVVGASPRNYFGRTVLLNLRKRGFTGVAYAINASGDSVEGYPAYPSLSEAPTPDVVVIVVARERVLAVVEECVALGVAGVIILSAGFAESHEQAWIDEELRIRKVADAGNIVLVGPNALGVIANDIGAYIWGGALPWTIEQGRTALIMQSGGVLSGSLATASTFGLGIAAAMSIGNGNSVGAADWVAALAESDGVDLIGLMLEGMPTWTELSFAGRAAAAAHKTIFVLKTGKSEAGARAAATHTGSLVGSHATSVALLAQAGMHECDSMGGLMTALALHSRFGDARGNNVAIMSASGGAIGVLADAASERGIGLYPFSTHTQNSIRGKVGISDPSNPLDLGGQSLSNAVEFSQAVEAVMKDDDLAVAVLLPSLGVPDAQLPDHQHLVNMVVDAAHRAGKPVVVAQLAFPEATASVIADYRDAPMALISPSVEFALDGIKAWLRTYDGPPRRQTPLVVDEELALKIDASAPAEHDLKALFAAIGLPVPDAKAYAPGHRPPGIPYPVVLKGVSPGVAHKTKAGLIALNVVDEAELDAAESRMMERAKHSGLDLPLLLVEKMAPPGRDVFVSISNQPIGTIVTVGQGGTDVEERADVSFLGWPATAPETEKFLATSVTWASPVQLEALSAAISGLISVYEDRGFELLECNPIRVHESSVTILDAVALHGASATVGAP